ncbi:MAG: oligosaccharide flippase family protein [Saprospiraceae bacterium]
MPEKKHSLVKAGSYSLLSSLSMQGFNFLGFLWMVKMYDAAWVGNWVIYMVIYSMIDMTRQGMVQNGFIKIYAGKLQGRQELVKAAFVLHLITGFGLSILVWVFKPLLIRIFEMELLGNLLNWLVLHTILLGFWRFREIWLTRNNDFKSIFYYNFSSGILGLLWLLIGGFFKIPMTILLPGYLGFYTLGQLFRPVFLKKEIKGLLQFPGINQRFKKYFFELFHFGKMVLGTNLASMLFQRADIFMIGAMLPASAVAIYNLATRIITLIDLPLNSISQVVYPKMVKAGRDFKSIHRKYLKMSILLHFSISILILVGLDFLWNFLMNAQHQDSPFLIKILLLGGLIKPWGRMLGIGLDAMGMPKINFQNLVFSLVLNVIFNAIMIPHWGLNGAAFATGLAVLLTIIAGQIRFHFLQKSAAFQTVYS